jgi:hypothetical protein
MWKSFVLELHGEWSELADESYERGCQGKIFLPSSPRGDGCGDWHPARSEIWRGFVFATCLSQTMAVVGFCSKVS